MVFSSSSAKEACPLFVDLDGTLLRTDTLWEMWVKALFSSPIQAILCLRKVFISKAAFKHQVALHSDIDVALLPLNSEFYGWLNDQYHQGRVLILATGADRGIAERVSAQLGIFTQVLASDGKHNLVGPAKLAACQKLAPHGFAYAGNASADFILWRHAEQVIVVNARHNVIHRTRPFRNVLEFDRREEFNSFLKELRPHQWSKNLLIFLVCITSHRFDLLLSAKMILALCAFCLSASSVYFFNDLFDLWADREHPKKKRRPIAAGDLALSQDIFICPLLAILGIWCAAQVSSVYVKWIFLYLVLTTVYSFWGKKIPIVDILMLAVLYCLRVMAGSVVTGIVMTPWLGFFCAFIFVSLACSKRVSELILATSSQFRLARRGYRSDDVTFLSILGVATGIISVLISALYIQQPRIKFLYYDALSLWMVSLCVFFWISRIWLLTMRGEMHIDPIAFALKDKTTYFMALFVGVWMYIAALGFKSLWFFEFFKH